MHIPDWDERFLAEYDPVTYADLVASTGAQSVMVYANSHVGLALWPASLGGRHRALGSDRGAAAGADTRDLFGETITALAARGIEATAYYSVIFNNWAARTHPQWRMQSAAPLNFGPLPGQRYGLVCPNNTEYLEFAAVQLREIAAYQITALFLDMAFWPTVCRCPVCAARCEAELGIEIPAMVDWDDHGWCRFARARERWLIEFVRQLRETVRSASGQLAVYHNSAVILGDWSRGYSFEMAQQATFLGGDFYGGGREQSTIARLLTSLSVTQPVEFMTTLRGHLTDHEDLRPAEELESIAVAATAHGAAIRFIDAVDPAGTLNHAAYASITPIFADVDRRAATAGGSTVAEVAVYASDYSKAPWQLGSLALEQACATRAVSPHIEALLGAVEVIESAGVPLAVLTRANLDSLAQYRLLVVPNARYLGSAELAAFGEFLQGGGAIYWSGECGLGDEDGARGRPGIEIVTGQEESGDSGNDSGSPLPARCAYLLPRADDLHAAISPARMATVSGPARLVVPKVTSADTVLAGLALPVDPALPSHRARFSSIHSDPPWPPPGQAGEEPELPGIIERVVGDGRLLVSAAAIESAPAGSSASRLFLALVARLMPEQPMLSVTCAEQVAVTVREQPEADRCVITFRRLNAGGTHRLCATIRLRDRRLRRCWAIEEDAALQVTIGGGGEAEIVAPAFGRRLTVFVDYESQPPTMRRDRRSASRGTQDRPR